MVTQAAILPAAAGCAATRHSTTPSLPSLGRSPHTSLMLTMAARLCSASRPPWPAQFTREGAATTWQFQECRIDTEHLASVCLEEREEREDGRVVEGFTVLTVGEVLAMFPNSSSAVFRPPDGADFALYDRKLRTKPF